MRNRPLIAVPLVAILASLSILHAYWALGGRRGIAYTVPTFHGRRAFDPSPLATWAVCGLLAMATLMVVAKVRWMVPSPLPALLNAGVWALSLVFLLRAVGNLHTFGFFKTVKGTPFADLDTWLYSPLCLLIAILAAGLAL